MNNKLDVSFWKDVLLTERGSVWCFLLCYITSPWHLWRNQSHMLRVVPPTLTWTWFRELDFYSCWQPLLPWELSLLLWGMSTHLLLWEHVWFYFILLPSVTMGLSITVHTQTLSGYEPVSLGGTVDSALSRVGGAVRTIRHRGHNSVWRALCLLLLPLETLTLLSVIFLQKAHSVHLP